MKKMNNKGFSLVELIVVVLIMAIIAVALAPQVMKWVENSRKSTDASNYDTIVSAANIALTNEKILANIPSAGTAISATSTGDPWSFTDISGTGYSLSDEMDKTLGDGWETKLAPKAGTLDALGVDGTTHTTDGYTLTIKAGGTVERTKNPFNPNS